MSAVPLSDFNLFLVSAALVMISGITVYVIKRLMPYIDSEGRELAEVQEIVRRIDKQTHALTQIHGRLSGSSESGWEDGLVAAIASLADGEIANLDANLAQSNSIIGHITSISIEEFDQWRETNRINLEKLLAAQEVQRTDLAKTKTSLDQARATVLSLRSKAAAVDQYAGKAEQLREANALKNREVGQLRDSHIQDTLALESMQRKVAGLTRSNAQLSAELLSLKAELSVLRSEKDAFDKTLQELSALHARTLQEKEFIEEAFMKLDGHFELIDTPPGQR